MISSTASKNQAIKAYDQSVLKYDFKAIRTMDDAIANDCPSLVKIEQKLVKAGYGEKALEQILQYMIAKTVKAFNISRNMEPEQIIDLSTQIRNDFYFLKLSEIFFVFKEARSGKMGKIYERLDEPTIMQWFNDYTEQRINKFEEKSLIEHHKNTYDEKGRQYDDYMKKLEKDKWEKQSEVKRLAEKMAYKMNSKKSNSLNEFNMPNINYPDYSQQNYLGDNDDPINKNINRH